MTININYSKKETNKSPTNIVFFTDDKFSISNLKPKITENDYFYINDLLKDQDLKKNLLVFEINSKKK